MRRSSAAQARAALADNERMTASSDPSSHHAVGNASGAAPDVPVFVLRGEYIELDKLLKVNGWADSGGAARRLIADGQVLVDGQVELRKTAKIRAGQVVAFDGHNIRVEAGG